MFSTKWIIAGVACLTTFAAVQPYRPMFVVGKSMTPTYQSGELLWTRPIDRPLQRGDVVLADGPEGPVIKRVALLPGDRRAQWYSCDGWVDLARARLPKKITSRIRTRMCTVPPGTVYLMGDNLGVSIDSRSYGPITTDRIRRFVIDDRDPAPDSIVAGEIPQGWLTQAVREGQRHMVASRATNPPRS